MTKPADDDDAKQLADLSKDMPAIDVDSVTAERMAHRLRQDLGKPPSPRRFVLPIVAALVVLAYGVWMVLKVLEVRG